MNIPVDEDTTWWCLKAGRGGVLEDDWLERGIVTTGWGDDGGDFRDVSPEEFVANDPSQHDQLSKFVGLHDRGMAKGDVVIAYAPERGHVSGIGRVGEARYDEPQTFDYLTDDEARDAQVHDHYYWRPTEWFDWGTPVLVTDLSERYQVNGADQLPTPMTLNQYGTLATDRDRIETLVEEINAAETVDTSQGGFGPEREARIQEWVADNIRTVGLYNPRREVRTNAGRIDVLAESDDGETVIEIKLGRAGDRALGQLLGYMGAREGVDEGSVRGMLIAEDFTPHLRHAVSVLDDVVLYRFEVQTSLTPV